MTTDQRRSLLLKNKQKAHLHFSSNKTEVMGKVGLLIGSYSVSHQLHTQYSAILTNLCGAQFLHPVFRPSKIEVVTSLQYSKDVRAIVLPVSDFSFCTLLRCRVFVCSSVCSCLRKLFIFQGRRFGGVLSNKC